MMKKLLVLVLCLSLTAGVLAGCASEPESAPQTTTSTAPVKNETVSSYSVTVQNEAGTALDKVMVEVYADSGKTDIVQAKKTDGEGKMTFSQKSAEGMVAVLVDAPAGYLVEEYYPLTGEETVISLKTGAPLTEEHLNHDKNNALFSLGDAMPDFTVTTSDGAEHTLSKLLETHDAVVLNFWYLNCNPCKQEFPYLQEAYEQFSDKVAVIALNPVEGSDEEIESFRQENGYTFPMGKCDLRWGKMLKISSYPVTMVIDRYGNIVMSHNGSVDNAQMFMDMFVFFSAEDYKQTFIRSHSQLPTYEP